MAFGFTLAPATFQGIMNIALSRARRKLKHGTYMDDCTVGNNTLEATWQDTLEAMICLLRQGLPINIWKCQFLRTMLSLLGVVLSGERFQLGKKSIAKLFATEIPCNLMQLQSLLGELNFASTFVADYKRKVAPLISLLSSKSGGQWT